MSNLIEQLKGIVGETHVLDKKDVALRARHFWDSSPMQALALVRPASTEEVSEECVRSSQWIPLVEP